MDRTQDPRRIAGGLVTNMIEDLPVNQEPSKTDYNTNYINVVMRPTVKQDTSQMGTAGDSPTWGVTDPTRLYTALLDSVPDADPHAKKGKKSNGP